MQKQWKRLAGYRSGTSGLPRNQRRVPRARTVFSGLATLGLVVSALAPVPAQADIFEDLFAEAGGHAYGVAAGTIQSWNSDRSRHALDANQKAQLRPHFGDLVDRVWVTYGAEMLDRVEVAGVGAGIDAAAQTFGHAIYVRRPKSGKPAELLLLAHEMVHSRQFEDAGSSLTRFGNRYFRAYYRADYSYANNAMEVEADAIATQFERWLREASRPAVGVNADGSVVLFLVGGDGKLYHKRSWSGSWTSWALLAGPTLQVDTHVGEPAVLRRPDGCLVVRVRNKQGNLNTARQVQANGDQWVGWGVSDEPEPLASDPVMALNADGRLEVFARQADGDIVHRWQLTVNPDGSWSDWERLWRGMAGKPAVVKKADGSLMIFARDAGGTLHRREQSSPNGGATKNLWNASVTLAMNAAGDPSVATNHDGRLEVFWRGTDNALWHQYQLEASGALSHLFLIPFSLGGGIVGNPTAVTSPNGRIVVFARGLDKSIFRMEQNARNSSLDWTSWQGLGGGLISDPVVGAHRSGVMEVFALGLDAAVWSRRQSGTSGSWADWGSLGGSSPYGYSY